MIAEKHNFPILKYSAQAQLALRVSVRPSRVRGVQLAREAGAPWPRRRIAILVEKAIVLPHKYMLRGSLTGRGVAQDLLGTYSVHSIGAAVAASSVYLCRTRVG